VQQVLATSGYGEVNRPGPQSFRQLSDGFAKCRNRVSATAGMRRAEPCTPGVADYNLDFDSSEINTAKTSCLSWLGGRTGSCGGLSLAFLGRSDSTKHRTTHGTHLTRRSGRSKL